MPGPHFEFERERRGLGARAVAGVDEVGRGPLAGPVGVAAVILDPHDLPEGLDDSKVLPAAMREALSAIILAKAHAVAIAFASAEEIDRYNIRGATLRAMARAVSALAIPADFALIDGRDLPDGLPCPARAVIGGDGLCLSIAAASIVAKVARDRLMARLDPHFPHFGFARHCGYATLAHRRALGTHGPTPLHRKSFQWSAPEQAEGKADSEATPCLQPPSRAERPARVLPGAAQQSGLAK